MLVGVQRFCIQKPLTVIHHNHLEQSNTFMFPLMPLKFALSTLMSWNPRLVNLYSVDTSSAFGALNALAIIPISASAMSLALVDGVALDRNGRMTRSSPTT